MDWRRRDEALSLFHPPQHGQARGTLQPGIKYLAFPLKRSDVIIGASDGFCLASYRLLNAVQRTILLPDRMPEAILHAQSDSTDDVTLVCAVI